MVQLRTGGDVPFVGRADELATLLRYANDQEPVLLAGSAGSGKSRLVQEIAGLDEAPLGAPIRQAVPPTLRSVKSPDKPLASSTHKVSNGRISHSNHFLPCSRKRAWRVRPSHDLRSTRTPVDTPCGWPGFTTVTSSPN